MTSDNTVAAVVLAAGEGTRIKARRINKVAFKLGGKPMIWYSVETIKKAGIQKILVVVKFKEASVRHALGNEVQYVRQGEKKGTAAALESALPALPVSATDLIVMYGDDSAFYTPELLQFLYEEHRTRKAAVTVLSITLDDPTGLGRIVRNTDGSIQKIVEEKMATDEEKQIQEVNTGCYCFSVSFLKQYLGEIKKNLTSDEYYLTDIIDVALRHNQRVHVYTHSDNRIWFGVNTRSQWAKAALALKRKVFVL